MTEPDEPTISDPPAKQHGDALAEALESGAEAPTEETDEE